MNTNTVVEIIRRVEEGCVWYELNCSRHPYLYNKVLRIDLDKAMLKIAYELNNTHKEGCCFTIED